MKNEEQVWNSADLILSQKSDTRAFPTLQPIQHFIPETSLMTFPTLSQSTINSLNDLLSSYTTSSNGIPRLPGSFLAVSTSTSKSNPIYIQASGLRNVEQPQDQRGPVNKGTKIPIASCTKLLTALSILSLFDERQDLNLTPETKVDKWLPELKRGTAKVLTGFKEDNQPILEDIEEGKDITIGMLLSHVSFHSRILHERR